MTRFTMKAVALLSLASAISASPCPYGDLAERGLLPREEADKFYAARSEGEAAVESQIRDVQKREHAAQEQYYKRQVDLGELLLGGGLLNGILQPFSGVLAALDVPVYVCPFHVLQSFSELCLAHKNSPSRRSQVTTVTTNLNTQRSPMFEACALLSTQWPPTAISAVLV